jgi:hypothetical protein
MPVANSSPVAKSQTKTAYMTKQQSNAVDAKSDEIAQLVRNFIE